MALGPPKPAIGVPNKDLSQVDHLMGDPADGERANHRITHLHIAALWQRLGRIPYAPKSNVAMQLQGNPETKVKRCAPDHTGTLKPRNSRFSLRYPASWRSRQIEKLGLLLLVDLSSRFRPLGRRSPSTSHPKNGRRCVGGSNHSWPVVWGNGPTSSARSSRYSRYRHAKSFWWQPIAYLLKQRDYLGELALKDCQNDASGHPQDDLFPSIHTSLRWGSRCDGHLGIPGRMGFLHAVRVHRHRCRRSDEAKSPAIAVHLLALRIRERRLLTHASIQHNDARDCSENSDFHSDSPIGWAELNRSSLFLAESHFTGRTPQSAIVVPCRAAVGGFHA